MKVDSIALPSRLSSTELIKVANSGQNYEQTLTMIQGVNNVNTLTTDFQRFIFYFTSNVDRNDTSTITK